MEEQSQLYQNYFYPEPTRKSIYQKNRSPTLQNEDYIQSSKGFACIGTGRILQISLPCRRRSYIELNDNESTSLLDGNVTLQKKFLPNRKNVLLSVFILFYIGFLILGSFTFRTFELNVELEERESYLSVRQAFLLKHPNVLGTILLHFYS